MKFLEVRDRSTFIPVIASKIICSSSQAIKLYQAAGYNIAELLILVHRLDINEGTTNPYLWGHARTMSQAHCYIELNYDSLIDGDVIDIEYILKETKTKKEPQ